jgi:Fe-S-cluster-containing hydrogenase component 2
LNLLSAAERLASIDRSAVTFDPGRCLRVLDTGSACVACSDLCPTRAIQVEEQVSFTEDKCTACLACLPACPTGAFSADDAVPALLTCAARLESGSVEVICKQHPDPGKGPAEDQIAVQVRGCLAGLGVGAYLSLAALGMSQISIRIDSCNGCPWADLLDLINVQIELARQILAARGLETRLLVVEAGKTKVERPVWDADNPPLSRRDLFRFASRQGQVALARTMAKDQAPHGQNPSRDRQRMHTALAHFPQESLVEGAPLLESGFADIHVKDSCSACGVCGRACPTGALELEKEENQYRLKFFAWKCVGCDLCLHICAQHSLEVNHQPSFEQVFGQPEIILSSGELVQCQRCNAWFAAGSDQKYCPTCEFRLKNPFGSKLPPGMDISKLAALRKK